MDARGGRRVGHANKRDLPPAAPPREHAGRGCVANTWVWYWVWTESRAMRTQPGIQRDSSVCALCVMFVWAVCGLRGVLRSQSEYSLRRFKNQSRTALSQTTLRYERKRACTKKAHRPQERHAVIVSPCNIFPCAVAACWSLSLHLRRINIASRPSPASLHPRACRPHAAVALQRSPDAPVWSSRSMSVTAVERAPMMRPVKKRARHAALPHSPRTSGTSSFHAKAAGSM